MQVLDATIYKCYLAHFLASALKKTCSEKVSYIFSKKSPPNFQETELSYIFLKQVFLIFRERYIQNPSVFRTSGIFRTLSDIYDEKFSKNSYGVRFSAPVSKFFPKNSLYFLKKNPLIFRNLNFSYISGKEYSEPWHNGTFLYFRKGEYYNGTLLYFWKWSFLILYFSISGSNFPCSKNEKKKLLKCFLYFGKWNFLASSLKNFLYFRRELARPENRKKFILVFKRKRKGKKFLILFLIKEHDKVLFLIL